MFFGPATGEPVSVGIHGALAALDAHAAQQILETWLMEQAQRPES